MQEKRRVQTTSTDSHPKMSAMPRWVKATFAVLLLALLAGGVWFYDTQKQAARQQAVSELSAIAHGKANQIVDWRKERLADAAVLMDSRFLAQGVARALADARGEADEHSSPTYAAWWSVTITPTCCWSIRRGRCA